MCSTVSIQFAKKSFLKIVTSLSFKTSINLVGILNFIIKFPQNLPRKTVVPTDFQQHCYLVSECPPPPSDHIDKRFLTRWSGSDMLWLLPPLPKTTTGQIMYWGEKKEKRMYVASFDFKKKVFSSFSKCVFHSTIYSIIHSRIHWASTVCQARLSPGNTIMSELQGCRQALHPIPHWYTIFQRTARRQLITRQSGNTNGAMSSKMTKAKFSWTCNMILEHLRTLPEDSQNESYRFLIYSFWSSISLSTTMKLAPPFEDFSEKGATRNHLEWFMAQHFYSISPAKTFINFIFWCSQKPRSSANFDTYFLLDVWNSLHMANSLSFLKKTFMSKGNLIQS